MVTDDSVAPNSAHDFDAGDLFFEERLEEPPFVYLGANYPDDIATDLPGHVYSFELAWKESKPIKVFELLGSPNFQLETKLDDAQLQRELATIVDLMQQYNIKIDIPPGEGPREVYRFITEIVFEQEVDDLKLGGLGRHFFYRENYSLK